MGKFKQFLINEEVGLGDLGARIEKFVNSPLIGNAINGAFVSTQVSGSDQSPQRDVLNFTDTDLTVPSVERSGRITCLLLKKNPIYVRLSDGTEAHFSYDEWRRIEGEPGIGKTMTIIFQRHPQDWSQQGSKIDHVIIRD
jgi:hypothetical protein